MASGFAPEFLILLGIDIFLGASILTVLLEKHFPGSYPYILEGAALIGFAELMSGPSFLTSLSTELQFWYSFIYAMIAVLSLFATNLYLLFLRRRTFESAVIGICGTVPAGLGILYFTSAFVNGLTVSLPLVPVIPIEGVYAMFGLSIGLVVFSLVLFGRRTGPASKPVHETPIPEPFTPASGEHTQLMVIGHPEKKEESRLSSTAAVPGETESPQTAKTVPPHKPETTEDSSAAGGTPTRGRTTASSAAISTTTPPPPNSSTPPTMEEWVQNTGTVLVRKAEVTGYSRRLLDSIRFFEKAVDHPARLDPMAVAGVVNGAKTAYLTPAGMLTIEDSAGKTISVSLLDISTDEALRVMREAMKGLKEAED
ncbi:MAG: hypothetical protein JRN06_03100 [Nitrososphaerota archaeon]|nr:hypothetical protein [Nitrososphaerota archaeon]MDG7023154.1 hypothetical protein [Nitrososphaerota archaeon]